MICMPWKVPTFAAAIALTGAIALAGCASPRTATIAATDQGEGVVRQRCLDTAVRRQRVQIPVMSTTGLGVNARTVAPGMTFVDVPLGIDEMRFAGCMQEAGYPTATVDPEPYRELARECLRQADAAGDFGRTYRDCVGRSGIRIDVDTEDAKPPSR